MTATIARRAFIAALGGAASWPLAARAQPGDRVRRIGVLISGDENDPVWKTSLSAFTQALADFGWTDGRNVRMDLRWGGGDINRIRALAQELVGLQPDIIVTNATPATTAVQQETRTIPIVFGNVSDPVASGLVARLDRPSGNITGFAAQEPPMGGKWLELLSEIAPGLKRAAIMFNPDTAPASSYVPSFETAARSLKVVPITAPGSYRRRDRSGHHRPGARAGRRPCRHAGCVHECASRVHHIGGGPKQRTDVYSLSVAARDGGLLSYGFDLVDNWRRAATYVDRILRGAKPGDLPVQFPVKYETILNRKTAKALGLAVPLSILLRADEVIE
jgi:putative ABC transport system substrate-binding protein